MMKKVIAENRWKLRRLETIDRIAKKGDDNNDDDDGKYRNKNFPFIMKKYIKIVKIPEKRTKQYTKKKIAYFLMSLNEARRNII